MICPASPLRPIRRALLAALPGALALAAAGAECPIVLRDVAARTGIAFEHTDGSSGRKYIVETVTAGVALFDYNNDGKTDIYFLNGRPLPGAQPNPQARNRLYRNDGGFRFTDVTQRAGVDGGADGFGLGVCAGDYDNDGFQDLYVSNYGENILFRNNGDGTFTDATKKAGAGRGHKFGAGVCFLDYDNDGFLDLFVANYLKFAFDKHVVQTERGHSIYATPSLYTPDSHNFFRNNGNGTFADVTEETGFGDCAGYGMGTVAADYDDDGRPDIFVANDVSWNSLFRNTGQRKFKEVGLMAGVAFDMGGRGHANMGVDCADYDNDGLLDFYVTAYQNQGPVLYKNLGHGLFEDVTLRTGAAQGAKSYVTWGCGFVDLDNDGYRDLFVVCGHTQDNVELYDDTTSYRCHNIVLRNTGNGKFVNVTADCGDVAKLRAVGRGAAFDDLDNDGRVDVVVLNSRGKPTILRNETVTGNHWLQIRLRGVESNRDGVGARVKVVAGGLTQIDEVHSGRGYQSHWGTRLHFGLGKNERIDCIEVRWPGRGTEVFKNVAVDRQATLVEGGGRAVARPIAAAPSPGGK